MKNRIDANAAEAVPSPSGSQSFRGPAEVEVTWSASGDRRSVRCAVTSQEPNGERTIHLDEDRQSGWFEIGVEPDRVEGELTLTFQQQRATLSGDFSTGPSTAFRGDIATWTTGSDQATTPARDGVVIRSLAPCGELFPFLWVRAPTASEDAAGRFVRWAEPKPFPATNPGDDLIAQARAFAASSSYLGDPASAETAAAELLRIADALFDAQVEDPNEVARDILDAPPARYLRTAEAQELETKLWQTFAADALVGPSNPNGVALVLRAIRARAVLAQLADGAGDPKRTASAIVVLPEQFALRPEAPFAPASSGWVAVLGVGVLEVVEKSLEGYELGDIARTVNVMPFESRVDRRRETRTYERDDEARESHDTETEEHRALLASADLDREIRDVLGGESICRDYTGITPKTGPAGFCVSLTGKWNGTDCIKERSRRQAATFAQRITERAAKRLEARSEVARSQHLALSSVREEASRIDNRGRAEPNVGVFKWLEKVYALRLSDRGLRLLTELVLDAPAANLVKTIASTGPRALVAPVPLTKLSPPIDGPTDVQATNYRSLCARYGVHDVPAPPRKLVTVSSRFERLGVERVGSIEIPEGYAATDGVVTYALVEGDVPVIGLVGTQALKIGGASGAPASTSAVPEASSSCADCPDPFTPLAPPTPATGTTKLTTVTPAEGTIPVVFRSESPSFAVTVDLSCTLDDFDDRLLAWQEETYRRLFDAYEAMHATYFEQLRARIEERTAPDRARVIERVLTRHGMTVLAAKAPDGESPALSRFFEAAFDWSSMAYRFDAWGAGSQPNAARCCFSGESNVDRGDRAEFDAFLDAESARVLLPIQPGYELAVLYYLATGKQWTACPPNIPVDESAVAALSELLAEDADRPRVDGPSWRVRVPTAITVLDDTSSIASSARGTSR